MASNPLEQFALKTIIPLKLGGWDISFTNAGAFMVMAILLSSTFLWLALKPKAEVPGRLQAAAESFQDFTFQLLDDNTAGKGRQYFPFIFSVFIFVTMLNLLGMMPFGFTVTSHLSVTFALAMVVFLTVTSIGFLRHGLKFFSLFLPAGIPWALAPLIFLIEFFVYLTRPVSLCIRLSANMIAGHILMYIAAGFIAAMGLLGVLPITFIVVFTGFEIFIALLQAYIFTILSCVYLNDAIQLH